MTKSKLPPLPDSAFEEGHTERHELPTTKHKHNFTLNKSDVVCTDCPTVWPGLAKHVMIINGEITNP